MYLRKALNFHLPKALISASDMPLEAVQDAAPMRKCEIYTTTHPDHNQRKLRESRGYIACIHLLDL